MMDVYHGVETGEMDTSHWAGHSKLPIILITSLGGTGDVLTRCWSYTKSYMVHFGNITPIPHT